MSRGFVLRNPATCCASVETGSVSTASNTTCPATPASYTRLLHLPATTIPASPASTISSYNRFLAFSMTAPPPEKSISGGYRPALSMFVAIPWASKTNHTRGGARFEHRNFRDIGLQPGSSCKSPDSQYAATDICGSTPAVRCRRNEGTCTRHHAHKYLWQCIHCQVCTKRPYLLPADGTAFRSIRG